MTSTRYRGLYHPSRSLDQATARMRVHITGGNVVRPAQFLGPLVHSDDSLPPDFDIPAYLRRPHPPREVAPAHVVLARSLAAGACLWLAMLFAWGRK